MAMSLVLTLRNGCHFHDSVDSGLFLMDYVNGFFLFFLVVILEYDYNVYIGDYITVWKNVKYDYNVYMYCWFLL